MWWKLGLLGLTTLLCIIHTSHSVAVMSIDLGSEWMKIAIVSPGVPMEIALNKESKRKTPVAVAFRDGDRLFGEDAMGAGMRYPSNTYFHILDLLGKKVDNPMVKLFQKRFPYYTIVPDPERGTVVFQLDSNTQYTLEELLAMILKKAQDIAQEYAQQVIKDVVITVPVFFNQAERRAVLKAAELSGLKVLQLINDNTAVALNYGMFRRKDFNGTVKHIMFYDMGAYSTSATIVGYQIIKTKERGWSETHPQLSILGVGYDRTLGGLEMQVRLRDFLARKFNEMKKTPNDAFQSPRAMSKLLKEAGRVKNILSVNVNTFAQVEGLLDDMDFKVQVTREEFEEMCSELFDKVKGPIDQALRSSGMSMDAIDQVILVGAGTRVPKVQEKLTEVVGAELGKSINTDEAAAMGAVYKAADLSTGFKVKKFITKDAVIFPIQVDFEREIENEDGTRTMKAIKRTLFGSMNPYPQKKILTFNKHVKDFLFHINYGELDALPKSEINALGSLNVTKIVLSGIADALNKNKGDNVESKGVKAHFTMDESGVLNLTQVESVFEKTVLEPEPSKDKPSTEEESTLSKLGSTITRLFSGGGEDGKETRKEGEDFQTEEVPGEEAKKEEEKKDKQPEEKPEKKTEDKVNKTEKSKKGASAGDAAAKNDTKKEEKPKVVILREPLVCQEEHMDLMGFNGENFLRSLKKIEDLDKFDILKRERQAAQNNLESFVVDTQVKLWMEEYEAASTEEEREVIRAKCSEISDWLYEDGLDAETAVYEAKLLELQSLTADLFVRVKEHQDLPEAVAALQDMINASATFLAKAQNLSEEEQVFTSVELETLDKLIQETKKWTEEKVAEQASLSLVETPKLTVKMIADKMGILDREIKYLVNKAKIVKTEREKEKRKKEEEEKKAKEEAKKNKTEQKINKTKASQESKEESKTEEVKKSEEAVSSSEEKLNTEEELNRPEEDKPETEAEVPEIPDTRQENLSESLQGEEASQESKEESKTEEVKKSEETVSRLEKELNTEEELSMPEEDKPQTEAEVPETPNTRQEDISESLQREEGGVKNQGSVLKEGSETDSLNIKEKVISEPQEEERSDTQAEAEEIPDSMLTDKSKSMERKENKTGNGSEDHEERLSLDTPSDSKSTGSTTEDPKPEKDTDDKKKHNEL